MGPMASQQKVPFCRHSRWVRRTPGQCKVGSLFDEENRGLKDCQILDVDGAVNVKALNVIEATKLKNMYLEIREV